LEHWRRAQIVVHRAAKELEIPEGYAEPLYDVFATTIGDTERAIRQAKKAGVISAAVQAGAQAVNHLHKIQPERPDYLLGAWPDLQDTV
jgi:hypothetical protein